MSDSRPDITNVVIGTAQYMSPEQARGEASDGRSDVYAAGCVLFELLTGRPPFLGDSPVAVAYQHVREVPPVPSSVNQKVPPPLDAIVLRALEKSPANRYQTCADMRRDLMRVLSGQRPAVARIAEAIPRPVVQAAEQHEAYRAFTADRSRPSRWFGRKPPKR
jgi:serine/threonine-protein kinase